MGLHLSYDFIIFYTNDLHSFDFTFIFLTLNPSHTWNKNSTHHDFL